MKVLHVLDHSVPLQSGYSFRTLSVLRCQRDLGIDTYHLTSPKHHIGDSLEDSSEGFHFYRTLKGGGLADRLPVINQLRVISLLEKRLQTIVNEIKPDLMHVHSPVLNGLAALRIRAKTSIPVVYEMRASWEDAAVDHGTTHESSLRYRISRSLESWVLRRANAIVTISEGLRNDILSRGITSDRITLAPNAIDLNAFQTHTDKSDTSMLADQLSLAGKKVIGFIGSFYGYEGLELLVEAFAKLSATEDDLRLLLVGGGVQEENLKRQVKDLSLNNKVVFTGRIPHGEVTRYYSIIDLFVYPRHSMRLTELVTPLKPLEAMASQGAVVASNVGGHRELIKDGETGVLFQSGSIKDLSEKMGMVLGNPALAQQLSANGRRFIETERNWRNTAERYLPVYQKLV